MPKEKFVRQKPKIKITDIGPKNRDSITTKAALEFFLNSSDKLAKGEDLGYTLLVIKKEE